ncbi:hypothetical protein SLS62_007121 [Diatrype stigma]|uniref:NmrA-like domain-containing protein n=1 Tax=Diatrype stigma TaxID=117547 RepID=A0AAN9UNT9_9PEZI
MAGAQIQPILVVGAGELGTAVLEALAAHPRRNHHHHSGDAENPATATATAAAAGPQIQRPLSVLLRASTIASTDAAKRAANEHLRADLGVALEPGDVVADPEASLAAVFRRFHTVVVCAGMGLPAGTQLKIARAAVLGARGGVARFVPWQWGIDYDVVGAGSAQDLFDEQLAVRALLRSSDAAATTSWTIVSVGLFMSFLFHPGFGVVDLGARTVRALGSWDTPVTVTAVRDIGRVAAEVVCDPGPSTSGVVYAGGDTVTYGRVAELVEARFPRQEWRREEWTLEVLRRRLEESPADAMVKYQNVFGAGRGVAWDLADTINRRRGLEMTTVEMYLAQMEDLEA